MADEYISREEADSILCYLYITAPNVASVAIARARHELHERPAADVQPVRHGRWEKNNDGIMVWWECSECHLNAWYDGYNLYDYCPDCGAKMDGGGT